MHRDKLFLIFLRQEQEVSASIGGEFHLGSEHCNRPSERIRVGVGCFTFFVIKIGIERHLLLQNDCIVNRRRKSKVYNGLELDVQVTRDNKPHYRIFVVAGLQPLNHKLQFSNLIIAIIMK